MGFAGMMTQDKMEKKMAYTYHKDKLPGSSGKDLKLKVDAVGIHKNKRAMEIFKAREADIQKQAKDMSEELKKNDKVGHVIQRLQEEVKLFVREEKGNKPIDRQYIKQVWMCEEEAEKAAEQFQVFFVALDKERKEAKKEVDQDTKFM